MIIMNNKKRERASSSKRDNAESSRRSHISELCSDLTSSIPSEHLQDSKNVRSQADQVKQATNYIVSLKGRVDGLQKRKEQLEMMMINQDGTSSSHPNEANLPIIELKDLDNYLEIQLVMEQDQDVMLHEVIRVLEEEGAEVVNATSSTSGNKVFHTLHAQARSSRVGIETSRVRERLNDLIR